MIKCASASTESLSVYRRVKYCGVTYYNFVCENGHSFLVSDHVQNKLQKLKKLIDFKLMKDIVDQYLQFNLESKVKLVHVHQSN